MALVPRVLRNVLLWGVILVLVWASLLAGLPRLRAMLPDFCARWNLAGGFCTARVQEWLGIVDQWAQRYLRPWGTDGRVLGASEETTRAFRALERAVREQLGEERTDAAVRGADLALKHLETLATEGRTDTHAKLAALPENARILLARARVSFEQLRSLLQSTQRRAEDVSHAVTETQRALDALSNVLPEDDEGRPE